jgi:hypothetical protein
MQLYLLSIPVGQLCERLLVPGLGATEKFCVHRSILSSPRCRAPSDPTTCTDTAEPENLSLRTEQFCFVPVSVLGEVQYGSFDHRKARWCTGPA